MASVKEIEAECKRLFAICDDIEERIDVYYAKKKLKNSLLELNTEYVKEIYDETKIAELKSRCNREAIYLEYIISKFDRNLRERYLDRVQLTNLFSAVDGIIREESANGYANKDLVNDMFCNYAQIDRLVRNARQLIFELSCEDRQLVDVINDQINKYKGVC